MSIADPQLEMKIHQYISGQLPEAEALAFEASFLADPELISMIESEQAMQRGFLAAEQSALGVKAQPQIDANDINREPWHHKIMNWLISPIPVPSVALALGLVAVGGIPIVTMTSDQLNELDRIMIVNGATEVTRTVVGPQDRMLMDLSTPKQAATALMIKVKTSLRPYETYRLKVSSAATNKPIWTSTPFTLNSLDHGLVIVPEYAAIQGALVDVVAIDGDANEVSVKFCHYSEVCR